MKTEVKKVDATKREINVEVNPEAVKNKFEAAFQEIAKEAKVPGFRPGRAPRDIIEKSFSSQANELVLKELIPQAYEEALRSHGLEAIELPQISDVQLTRERLFFKAMVEVAPEIKLKDYRGLKVNHRKISVSPDEIKRSIDSLRESRKAQKADDAFARGLGFANLSRLEAALEKQLFMQKENQQKQSIESEVIRQLSAEADFKIPQSLVNRQLQDLVSRAKLDLVLKGLPREEAEAREKELSEKLRPQAESQVKIYLILAQIAKKENIPQDEQMTQRVMEFLLKEAEWKEIM